MSTGTGSSDPRRFLFGKPSRLERSRVVELGLNRCRRQFTFVHHRDRRRDTTSILHDISFRRPSVRLRGSHHVFGQTSYRKDLTHATLGFSGLCGVRQLVEDPENSNQTVSVLHLRHFNVSLLLFILLLSFLRL